MVYRTTYYIMTWKIIILTTFFFAGFAFARVNPLAFGLFAAGTFVLLVAGYYLDKGVHTR
jgi:hypothetical protein